MIFTPRNNVDRPAIFSELDEYIQSEVYRLHDLAQKGTKLTFGSRHIQIWRTCIEPLLHLFHDKCAYCETELSRDTTHVDQFRPKARAINGDGKRSIGYYWLSLVWENLYPSCQQCNRHKMNRFPVKGPRLTYETMGSRVENTLLLDPCDPNDWKEKHFVYNAQGEILPLTEKGKTTIEVFGLNRLNHMNERKVIHSQFAAFNKVLDKSLSEKAAKNILDWLKSNLSEKQQHLGQRRFLASRMLREKRFELQEMFPKEIHEIEALLFETLPSISEDDIGQAWEQISKIPSKRKKTTYNFQSQQQYDIKSKNIQSNRSYFTGAKLIQKVEIVNFKGIKSLTFDFPKPVDSSEGESWMVLIGRNSTSKSTILQAIALALIGPEELNEINNKYNASDFVRRGNGISKGHVKIWMSNFLEPIELTFSKKENKFDTNLTNPIVMILAYGSTRILPEEVEPGTPKVEKYVFAPTNILNLFNPQNQLRDVEAWLGNPNSVPSRQFNQVKEALLELLDLDRIERDHADIFRKSRKVKVKLADGTYNMRELCDGYQSVMAYCLDIMITLFEKWPSIQDAEGIVLIDEIGVHLHPSWKIRIITLLRKVFPRVTFIVTTHDPLCLRGARTGEVYIMSRDPRDGNIVYEQIDIPPGTSIEKLYTGLWFSLDSTLDLETTELMAEHRRLVFNDPHGNKDRIAELEREIGERMRYQSDGSLLGEFKEAFSEVLEEATSDFNEDDVKAKLKAKLRNKMSKS